MKNKSIVILSFLLALSIIINIWYLLKAHDNIKVIEGNISNYEHMIDGYVPENGYVENAKTAVNIAKAIFENWGIKYGYYSVVFDENEQLWIVESSFVFQKGGYVIIQKQDGKIIRAWMKK